MSHRLLVGALVLLAAAAATAQAPLPKAAAPAAKTWTPPKTPWGDQDLQGIYTSDDLMDTPIERPSEFGSRLYFTEKELAGILLC